MKKIYLRFLLLGIFVVAFLGSAAAQVKLSARLDSTRIIVGGITHLHVTIQAPTGIELQTPKLRDSSKIELIDAVKTVTTPRNNGLLITQLWTLTALDSGAWTLPPMPFAYRLLSGAVDTVYSPELSIFASPARLDSLTLRPIAPILTEPLAWRDLLPFALSGFAIFFIAAAIYGYFHRKKRRTITLQNTPAPIIPPHELAVRKLTALAKKQLWQQGQTKEYYIELTYILREYLQNRYKLPILEQTTDDFLPLLPQKTDIPEALRRELTQQFRNADLIKFAKGEATAPQNEQALEFAFQFVEKTKQQPIEPEISTSTE